MERAPGSEASPAKKTGSLVKLYTPQHCPSSVENLSGREIKTPRLTSIRILFLKSSRDSDAQMKAFILHIVLSGSYKDHTHIS